MAEHWARAGRVWHWSTAPRKSTTLKSRFEPDASDHEGLFLFTNNVMFTSLVLGRTSWMICSLTWRLRCSGLWMFFVWVKELSLWGLWDQRRQRAWNLSDGATWRHVQPPQRSQPTSGDLLHHAWSSFRVIFTLSRYWNMAAGLCESGRQQRNLMYNFSVETLENKPGFKDHNNTVPLQVNSTLRTVYCLLSSNHASVCSLYNYSGFVCLQWCSAHHISAERVGVAPPVRLQTLTAPPSFVALLTACF